MPRHAGFAMVASLQQDLANTYLRVYFANNVSPQSITLPNLITIGGSAVSLSGEVALLPPEIVFAENPQNLIGVNLALAGSLSLSTSGTGSATVEAVLYTNVQLPLATPVVDGSIAPSIDLSHAVVTSIGIEVLSGPSLAPIYNAALTSPAVLNALTTGLQSIPSSLLPINPSPISANISFPQPRQAPKGSSEFPPFPTWFTINFSVDRVVYKVFTGAVTIAADMANYTSGDATQLVNLFTADGPGSYVLIERVDGSSWGATPSGPHNVHVAVLVNAVIFSGAVSQISSAVSGTLIDDHVEIRDMSLTLGYFTTDLYGDGNGATFVADVQYDSETHRLDDGFGYFAPNDGSPNIPATATFHLEYYLSTRDGTTSYVSEGKDSWQPRIVDANISLPFWLDAALVAASIVLPGLILAPLVVFSFLTPLVTLSELNSQLANAANQAAGGLAPALGAAAILSQSVKPLPQTANPQWLSIISGIALSQDGADAYLTYAPETWTSLAINGNADSSGVENGYTWSVFDTRPIVVSLPIEAGNYRPDDPSVFVDWAVTRTDTGATIVQQTQAWASVAGLPSVTIDHSSAALMAAPGFAVSCRCYRRLGYRVDEVFSGTMSITIADLLDRHHPFVRWNDEVYIVPGYKTARLGSVAEVAAGKQVVYWSRTRDSRIHRTDVPGRCLAVGPTAPNRVNGYIYSDALPFPLSEAGQKRHGVLCDYCFYGGPTKTTLLI
jgi:hypothetical protein